ncbi:MAG: hypothetical protein WBC29_00775, partial [Candidatus Moraniibacteriota bacterium]
LIYHISSSVTKTIELSAGDHRILPMALTLLQQHISEHVLTESDIDIGYLRALGDIEEKIKNRDPAILSLLKTKEAEALNTEDYWPPRATERNTHIVRCIANSIIRLANQDTVVPS